MLQLFIIQYDNGEDSSKVFTDFERTATSVDEAIKYFRKYHKTERILSVEMVPEDLDEFQVKQLKEEARMRVIKALRE